MLIKFNLAALKKTKGSEYLVRFALGGVLTALTGLIAQHTGPVIGGLFLAFPAIFPASATLVERHERDKKRRAGINDTLRGRLSAALDARGALLGALALIAFAVIVWQGLPMTWAPVVLCIALVAWLALATLLWRLRRLHTRWRVLAPAKHR
jgi:MFS family permease